MSKAVPPDPEARLRAEVDRAVAPYVGRVPPWALDKLRELAERYWREHPQASRILKLQDQKDRIRSGTESIGEQGVNEKETGKGKV